MKEQFIDFYNSLPMINPLIPLLATLLWVLAFGLTIILYQRKNRRYNDQKEESKIWRDKYFKDISEAGIEFRKLQTENTYLLKVNKGLCIRREKIVHESIDDFDLRKYTMERAMDLIKAKGLPIENTFNEVYKCLKP